MKIKWVISILASAGLFGIGLFLPKDNATINEFEEQMDSLQYYIQKLKKDHQENYQKLDDLFTSINSNVNLLDDLEKLIMDEELKEELITTLETEGETAFFEKLATIQENRIQIKDTNPKFNSIDIEDNLVLYSKHNYINIDSINVRLVFLYLKADSIIDSDNMIEIYMDNSIYYKVK